MIIIVVVKQCKIRLYDECSNSSHYKNTARVFNVIIITGDTLTQDFLILFLLISPSFSNKVLHNEIILILMFKRL